MNSIRNTILFMKIAHKGQVDKAGDDYYTHPLRVTEYAVKYCKKFNLSEFELFTIKQIALLHDVIEDTAYTVDDLIELGFAKEVYKL